MRTDSRTQTRNDRTTAAGMLGGAAVCGALAGATGSTAPVWLACGLLVGALMIYRRTVERRPYSYWLAWVTGAAVALLLAWQTEEEFTRLVSLGLAGVEFLVALVLFVLWRRRHTGRGDWIVWIPNTRTVLRREWSRRAAIHWADGFDQPCMISPLDELPSLAAVVPLYPYADRPTVKGPHLSE
ncbi:hypothetical protein [Streptomyces sp. NPDC056069]|uniref:hypothetical protein n=1 Tax=Streptomyces sp. NPDC056069 TaxID=3345702 RepID=UPI0035DAFBEB